jgi:hypothetical protein
VAGKDKILLEFGLRRAQVSANYVWIFLMLFSPCMMDIISLPLITRLIFT